MLDDIDERLIEALRLNGRQSARALARKTRLSESVVAARMKKLRDEDILRVVLRRDFFSMGYSLQCIIEVTVSDRLVEDVATDLASRDSINTVSIMLGSPELILVANARDRFHLMEILDEDIATVSGIQDIKIHTTIDIKKVQFGYAVLKTTH